MDSHVVMNDKKIHVFEPPSKHVGVEVTVSTKKSRKTFHLKRPTVKSEQPPLAVESFAVCPERYAELMNRVESLNRSFK